MLINNEDKDHHYQFVKYCLIYHQQHPLAFGNIKIKKCFIREYFIMLASIFKINILSM